MFKIAKQIADEQINFLNKTVDVFLKNKEIERMEVQNEFGAIAISRETEKSHVCAIGFVDDSDDHDEAKDNEEVEEDEDFWKQ